MSGKLFTQDKGGPDICLKCCRKRRYRLVDGKPVPQPCECRKPPENGSQRLSMRDWAYTPAAHPLQTALDALWRLVWISGGTAIVGGLFALYALPVLVWWKVMFWD